MIISGGGNTNTGNVSRKAFENPEKFAKITGFPQDLIEDFYFLIATLSCGQDVNPDSYDVLAKDWLRRFHANPDINWNWLSPTMHLVLEHGADIIRALPFNPGMSSEEAIEHGNKVQYPKCK